MNYYNTKVGTFCYFHPKKVFIGVCPFCLNEKLLILASNQKSQSHSHQNKTPINLPRISAFGSLLNRLEFSHRKHPAGDDSDHEASTSQEDSFISIEFEDNGAASCEKGIAEDNGAASCEKGTVTKVSLDHCSLSWNMISSKETKTKESKRIIEPTKNRISLSWRRRIGRLCQLIRLKSSRKANVYHAGTKVDGIKMRRCWIRSLNKRRAKS